MPALAQARPERLSDKDVKTLIDQVDEGRDKFEGNLDGQFKGSTVRGLSGGETKVAGALQDYQDNTQKLKDRFTPDYSASAEVTTVLKQSTAIDAFMQGAPSAMKGRSEWDRQSTNLKQLAESYGTTFPFPDGATSRRVNDKETAATATAIATSAGRFKSDLDKDKTLPKPEKDAAKKDVELLIKQADAVKSRTTDGKPATGEVRQLGEQRLRVLAVRRRLRPARTPLPIGPLNTNLAFHEIDVGPLQRHHLAGPQARLTAEEHEHGSRWIRSEIKPLLEPRPKGFVPSAGVPPLPAVAPRLIASSPTPSPRAAPSGREARRQEAASIAADPEAALRAFRAPDRPGRAPGGVHARTAPAHRESGVAARRREWSRRCPRRAR